MNASPAIKEKNDGSGYPALLGLLLRHLPQPAPFLAQGRLIGPGLIFLLTEAKMNSLTVRIGFYMFISYGLACLVGLLQKNFVYW